MATSSHCTTYDSQLQASVENLKRYPQLLPFIGSLWKKHEHRIMFVAESHYLAETSAGKSDSQTWYERDNSYLTETELPKIDTRRSVNAADDFTEPQIKAYSLFYRIKKAVFDTYKINNKSQTLFQNFGYYNYFQRPAEKTGESIINSKKDDQIAYETLKAIITIAKPTVIIFVSQKAHFSFIKSDAKEKVMLANLVVIHSVPHPGCAWWNRQSKKYGVDGSEPITGKAKFAKIIGALDFESLN